MKFCLISVLVDFLKKSFPNLVYVDSKSYQEQRHFEDFLGSLNVLSVSVSGLDGEFL